MAELLKVVQFPIFAYMFRKASFKVARRYLFAKKSANIINIITGLSITGLTVGTAALILVLAVFNGLESTIMGFFHAFNPDFKVEIKTGKTFEVDSALQLKLTEIEGVLAVVNCLEEVVLFQNNDQQQVGKIKGVSQNFEQYSGFDSAIIEGDLVLKEGNTPYLVAGLNIGNRLEFNIRDPFERIQVYALNTQKQSSAFGGGQDFKKLLAQPAGLFSVQQSYDSEYIFAPLSFVRNLLNKAEANTSLELYTSKTGDLDQIQSQIQAILGSDYSVKNRLEQQEAFLKLLRLEKWMAFLMLSLAALLVAFNMIGSLWMIVIDKMKDIIMLKCMGMTDKDAAWIVIYLGIIIAIIGIALGTLIAVAVYFLQLNYGFIGLQDGSALSAYPVVLKPIDFVLTYIVVILIACLAALPAAFRAKSFPAFYKSE